MHEGRPQFGSRNPGAQRLDGFDRCPEMLESLGVRAAAKADLRQSLASRQDDFRNARSFGQGEALPETFFGLRQAAFVEVRASQPGESRGLVALAL